MRGIGQVRFGKQVVYVQFSAKKNTANVRVSAEECDRLDLFAGQQVRIGLPGQEAALALVTAVVPAPPFAWVEAEFAISVNRAG